MGREPLRLSPVPGHRYRLVRADGHVRWSDEPGRYGGHRRSRIYGRLDCPSALRAIAAGYRPSARCLPDRYAAWRTGRRPDRAGAA